MATTSKKKKKKESLIFGTKYHNEITSGIYKLVNDTKISQDDFSKIILKFNTVQRLLYKLYKKELEQIVSLHISFLSCTHGTEGKKVTKDKLDKAIKAFNKKISNISIVLLLSSTIPLLSILIYLKKWDIF